MICVLVPNEPTAVFYNYKQNKSALVSTEPTMDILDFKIINHLCPGAHRAHEYFWAVFNVLNKFNNTKAKEINIV